VVLTRRETYRVPTPELGRPAQGQAITRDAGLAAARGGTPPPDTA
jgi:hypothetical protein